MTGHFKSAEHNYSEASDLKNQYISACSWALLIFQLIYVWMDTLFDSPW